MTKERQKKTNMYLLGIIGIVAIVGIVVLVLNSGNNLVTESTEYNMLIEPTDLTGQVSERVKLCPIIFCAKNGEIYKTIYCEEVHGKCVCDNC